MWDDNYDEGNYCAECDTSFYCDPHVIAWDEWHEQNVCPRCGHVEPELYLNDRYYSLGFYLLSVADDDHTWPEHWALPMYER